MTTEEIKMESPASPVVLTEAAINHIRHLKNKRGNPGLAVRIGVKGGGCSGLSYVLALEEAPRENDLIFQAGDSTFHVDPKSAKFVEGMVLDYSIKNLLEGGWVFTNPNASRTCGCGTSFQPKIEGI